MRVETPVGGCDQPSIKPPLGLARFVSGAQQNGLSLRVEREGHSPGSVSGIKA